MGRATKWFRSLLGFKKPDPKSDPAQRSPSKKRWSFSKGKDRRKSQYAVVSANDDDDTNRHAIAVAAATAAVAEAAIAAAHAAAAVVQLTSSAGFDRTTLCGYGREEWAAVAIQSHFRAYLSRRALRALRALVRLQALVRGRIQRRQNADKLRRLQAIVMAQARAQAGRVPVQESLYSGSKPFRFNHSARASPERIIDHRSKKHEHLPTISKRNNSRSASNISYDPERSPLIPHHWMDDDKTDKILEIDTRKPHTTRKCRNIFSSSHDQSFQSGPPLSPSSADVDACSFYTATNSPQYYYSSSVDGNCRRGGPSTPAKSDGSRSCMSGGYTDHPSYMAYTESSKAKARSVSAPRQRPQWERTSSVNRYSVPDPRYSTLQASFSLKAYPGSGRLDRLGLPVRDVAGFSGGLCHRY